MTSKNANPKARPGGDQAWIIVASPESVEVCAGRGLFGLNGKGPLPRVAVGDRLVAYIRGDKVFAGLGVVTEPYFMDDEPVFPGGLYPDRIGIKLDLLPPERRLDIWNFLDELTFPADKGRWQASLVGGIRQIPMSDYKVFEEGLGVNPANIR